MMLFPTPHSQASAEVSQSPKGDEMQVARLARGAVRVVQELVALGDPARRETRWRITLLTMAVFAALC